MNQKAIYLVLAFLSIICVHIAAQAQGISVSPGSAQQTTSARLTPAVDHHKHLMGPGATQLQSRPLLAAVEVPQEIAQLLRERTQRWNNKSTIGELYTENGLIHDSRVPAWFQGRTKIADFITTRFRASYHITPVAYQIDGSRGYIAGYLTRGNAHIGHTLLSLEKGADGVWRIAAESMTFPGPSDASPFTAEHLIAELDAAGIKRGVVLSAAYWFGSPLGTPVEDEYAKVRAENDWVAQEVAKFPDRLIAFCSFNPLKNYALEELNRCAKNPNIKGLKLHFGNSGVDVRKPEHVEKVRVVFQAANERRLPIVAHLWTLDPTYGKEHSEIFLNQILPAAPDITVQIAHMAGGGRSTDPALAVFADAIAAKDPRTKNLYFDIATLVDLNSPERILERDAKRMRQIGLERILWGSDFAGINDNNTARQQWLMFRALMPLTDEEIRTIAGNIAPYLQGGVSNDVRAGASGSSSSDFSLKDFQNLRWLEGNWRGSEEDGKNPFYERYSFVGDNRIEMQSFTDATMTKPGSEKSVTLLKDGAIYHQAGRAVWVAERFSKNEILFVPKENASISFVWKMESPNVWTAKLNFRDQNGKPAEKIYRLERIKNQ